MSWCGLCFGFHHFSKKSLFSVPAFYSLALKTQDAALEHFHPVGLFFFKSGVACYFMNSLSAFV